MQSDTALSPRLRHLLVQGDRRTDKLILPALTGSSSEVVTPRRSSEYTTSLFTNKPPVSAGALPAPRISDERRPSHIFSLLNDLSVASPRSPPSTAGSGSISPHRVRGRPSPGYAHPPVTTRVSAPLPGARPPFFGEECRSITQESLPPRPHLFRRHSSPPYEYSTASQPVAYSHIDYTPIGLGTSRVPISRTTRACDACRARKVRCDAGGNPGGGPSTCPRCRESGVPCVYSRIQKKRGPCPGTTRPTIDGRQGSRRGAAPIYPPEPSMPYHTYSSRSSYGYHPGPHPYPPPPHPYHQPPPVHRAGPQTTPPTMERPPHAHPYDGRPPIQPAPEPSRRYDSAPLQRKHTQRRSQSILSWPHMEPAKQVEDRRIPFELSYSMRASAASAGNGRLSSLFGDKVRQLPPLTVAIERRTSYYEA